MFNDKLHLFTNKNTIYQSKLKLLAIFCNNVNNMRAQFIIQSYLEVE